MPHKIAKREPAWKQSLRDVADNPDYIFWEMEGLQKELTLDHPSTVYLKEKHRHIGVWIDEIDKFHNRKLGRMIPVEKA
jgi:hypothetical protein